MPIARRPSGSATMALFQPWPLGSAITVFRRAKRVPESPLKTSTRPSEATYRRPARQTSPSGPSTPLTTLTGFAPARVTT